MSLLDRALALLAPQTPAAPAHTPSDPYRSDSWYNPTSGLGTVRDKMQAGYYQRDVVLDAEQLSALYYGDAIAARMVDYIVNEAFRKGYQLDDGDNNSEQAAEQLEWAEETLDLSTQLKQAITWGRVFGGGLMVVGADDRVADLSLPLNEKVVKGIPWLNVTDSRYAIVESYYEDFGPKLGKPKVYRVYANAGRSGKSYRVHESRTIRFGGVFVDNVKSQELKGWDLSVLQRPYDVLRAYGTAMQSAGLMVSDASQIVYKIKGLMQMLAAKQKGPLMERLQLLDLGRSTARAITLDTEEGFDKVATSFAGLPDTLDRFMNQLSAASGTPVSILMGRSAAGMNATGDLDITSQNVVTASWQLNEIGPRVRRLHRLLAADKKAPYGGKVPKKLGVKWHDLSIPTEKERAETYKLVAEAYNVLVQMGALDPAEVSLAMFARGVWSLEAPKIDVARLEKELKARAELDPMEAPQPPAPPGQEPPADPAADPAKPEEPLAEGEDDDTAKG